MQPDVEQGTEPRIIRKFTGFWALWGDSGIPPTLPPEHKKNLKFNAAVEDMDDLDLAAIREYDRHRSGGFVHES